MTETHNKLVRDKIPEIIKDNGDIPYTRTLRGEAYKAALKDKLIEEAREVVEADNEKLIDELADVQEVIQALISECNFDTQAVNEMQKRKREDRGGFTDGIFLESTK